MKREICLRGRSRRRLRVYVGFLLLTSLILNSGCPGGGGPTISLPKAPCKTTEIIVSDIMLTAHDTSGQTLFGFKFCLKCPAGEQGTPISNVAVTISVPGVNVPPQTVTSGPDGCVQATVTKAAVDVGTGLDLNGKPVKITIEGTDGKKDLPGPFTLSGT